MTKLGRSATVNCLVFAVLFLATSCSTANRTSNEASREQTRPAIAEQIAKTYGVDSFGQIDAIRYTFNIELPVLMLSRSWTWEPKTGKVSYEGKDKDGKPVKVSYVRSKLSGEPANVKDEIEPAFVNDQYWMLFPFHTYWDSSADVQDQGAQKLPLGDGTAKRVVVKYPAEAGGYTPGDTWELYLGPDYRIEEMVYHRGGPKKPSVVTVTWAGYQKAGPLLVSTDHRGTADGAPARVYFTNVAVKVAGSDNWVNAQ